MSDGTASGVDLLSVLSQRRRWQRDVSVASIEGRLTVPALADLVAQLDVGLFRWPYVQVLRGDAQVHPGRFTRSRTVMGTRVQGFVEARQVHELMDAGAVVLMHSIEHWNGPFDKSLRALVGCAARRTYAAFGRPLRLQVEPDPGLLGAAVVPLSGSEPVRVQASDHDVTNPIEPDQVLLLSDASVRTHRVLGDGFSGVAVVTLLRPTLDDALRALAQKARASADDVLTTRYHQWDIAERRRRAATLLVRAVERSGAEGATV